MICGKTVSPKRQKFADLGRQAGGFYSDSQTTKISLEK
jgi:hypothetical protein